MVQIFAHTYPHIRVSLFPLAPTLYSYTVRMQEAPVYFIELIICAVGLVRRSEVGSALAR